MEKGQTCERAKEDYRKQLEQTNSKQTLHFNSEMPAVFDVCISSILYDLQYMQYYNTYILLESGKVYYRCLFLWVVLYFDEPTTDFRPLRTKN